MTDLTQPGVLPPIERARLSAELLQIRTTLTGTGLSPTDQESAKARGQAIRAQLGAALPATIMLSGKEFGEFPETPEGKKELRAAVKTYLEGLRGQMVNCPALGAQVEIRQRGIKETLAFSGDPRKLKLMHAVPQIIASATVAQKSENHKPDKKRDVVAYYRLRSAVTLAEAQIGVVVLVEQDTNGHLYYDLLVDAPKEKAMMDSTGSSPDHYSGPPLEPNTASVNRRSPDYYSGHRLNSSVEQDADGVMLDSAAQLVLNLFLEDEPAEGTEAPAGNADAANGPFAVGKIPQKNGGVLVTGDPEALAAYVNTYMDQAKFTVAPTGLLFSKANARAAKMLPTMQTVLPTGAVIYTYADPVGVAVAYDRDISGIARSLGELKSLMAERWGPEKYRAVFGEDAAPADVQAYQDAQDANAARKQADIDAAAQLIADQQLAQEQAQAKAKTYAEETARILEQQRAQAQAEFEKTLAVGISPNPIYQAYLDTREDLPTHAGNTDFLGWAGQRAAEFERLGKGRISANEEAYVDFIRAWADQHLSQRVRDARKSAEPTPAVTEKGNPIIDEAVLVDLGLVREVFGRWKYRDAVGSPQLFANSKESAIERGSDAYAKADPSQLLTTEQRYDKANADFYADMDARYGKMSIEQVQQIAADAKTDPAAYAAAAAREFNGGGRRTGPAAVTQGARDGAEMSRQLVRYLEERVAKEGKAEAPALVMSAPTTEPVKPQIIEYKTKRDKILRGIVRTDLTLAEAKAIDPYTWRMNGGYFIREKHLEGDTSAVQAAPTPTMLTPEQQAEKQERDTREALERQQQAVASQVSKLRDAGAKAIESGNSVMNADRKTNTHRRAGMAASAYARGANDESEGQTLNNIADAIEIGAGGVLSALTSRTQLQELKKALSAAVYETDKNLSYAEKQGLNGRQPTEQDLINVRMPLPLVWSSRYKNAALTIAKKAPTGNSRLIAALTKMGQRVERWRLSDDGDIAITRKAYQVLTSIKDAWDLKDVMETLARVERLKRMGITNDAQMQDACRALLPHLAGKQEESAVTKAERAIIGQKVGIDFFPTPAAVAQRMARMAGITKDMRVLEPSAGNGNLADAAAAAGGQVDVIEISSQLRDILTAKGYTVVAQDFNDFTPDEPYKAILMNPPFSKRQDAEHIMRAYGMLASGGTLVAIAGEGVFFGQDQKAEQFRTWLDAHSADVEKLEGGTFNDNALLAQTSANARLIVLHK